MLVSSVQVTTDLNDYVISRKTASAKLRHMMASHRQTAFLSDALNVGLGSGHNLKISSIKVKLINLFTCEKYNQWYSRLTYIHLSSTSVSQSCDGCYRIDRAKSLQEDNLYIRFEQIVICICIIVCLVLDNVSTDFV